MFKMYFILMMAVLMAQMNSVLASPRVGVEIDAQQVVLQIDRADARSGSRGRVNGHSRLTDHKMTFGEDHDLREPEYDDDFYYYASEGGNDVSGSTIPRGKYDRGLVDTVGWKGGDGLLKVFLAAVDKKGAVLYKWYDSKRGWLPKGISGEWSSAGGTFNRSVSVTQFGDKVYISGITRDGSLLFKYFYNDTLYPQNNAWLFSSSGHMGTSTMASHDNKTLSIVARGSNGRLYHRLIDPETDTLISLTRIGDSTGVGHPSLVANGDGNLYLFQYDTDRSLLTATWDGDKWSEYEDLGGTYAKGSPMATGYNGKVAVAGVSSGANSVLMRYYDGKRWAEARSTGSGALQSVAPVFYVDYIDVYYQSSNVMQGRFLYDGRTAGPYDMRGQLTTALVGYATPDWAGGGRVDIWGIGLDGHVYQRWFETRWSNWVDFGGDFGSEADDD